MTSAELAPGIIHATDDLIRNDLPGAAFVVLNCSGINIADKNDRAAFNALREGLDRRTVALLRRVARPAVKATSRRNRRGKHSRTKRTNDT